MLHRCLWGLFLGVAMCHAQTQVITAETPVDTTTLHAWLHSGDPRLVSWAATFAERMHDHAIVSEMPDVLETWVLPLMTAQGEDNAAHRRAAIAMADALIQDSAEVPAQKIDAFADALPSQALILIARLPLPEAKQTLGYWVPDKRGSFGGPVLGRVAAMLLAKDPSGVMVYSEASSRGLVSAIVNDATEELTVAVSESGNTRELMGSGACGDSMGRPVTPGWPEVYSYDLEENEGAPRGGTPVVDLAGDVIAWHRYKENGGWGSCSGVMPLNNNTRRKLLAYWLGVSEKAIPWKAQQSVGIAWKGKEDYQRRLGELMDAERGKFSATVRDLQERGLLTTQEAADSIPKLQVVIHCDMTPCPLN